MNTMQIKNYYAVAAVELFPIQGVSRGSLQTFKKER